MHSLAIFSNIILLACIGEFEDENRVYQILNLLNTSIMIIPESIAGLWHKIRMKIFPWARDAIRLTTGCLPRSPWSPLLSMIEANLTIFTKTSGR